jgi:FtsP/CotA-like multicopper oxidase with cupredoxin domain
MFKFKKLNILFSSLIALSFLLTAIGPVVAQEMNPGETPTETPPPGYHGMVTPAERQAAADRAAAARVAAGLPAYTTQALMNPGGVPDYFGIIPNYANSPIPSLDGLGNWIPGTGIRKFMDSLPGLGPTGINLLNQYLPIAQKDTLAYPGSDYYEIAVVQYTQKLSRDLPATTLRGYVQISTTNVPGKHIALNYQNSGLPILDINGAQVYAVDDPQYLGPIIVSGSYDPTKPAGVAGNGQPTRVKFTNYLPTGTPGNLFIPVDTTVMGAGMGPTGQVTAVLVTNGGSGYSTPPAISFTGGGATTQATAVATIHAGKVNGIHITNPGIGYISAPTINITGGGGSGVSTAVSWVGATASNYLENRATLHLHGGNTPWISDGTPHQWTTPVGENSVYPEGVSVYNVPDMPDPGKGSLTFFYTNEQSARLMFYHDHAYGLTRLNVYAGEAAGYLLTDPAEQTLVNGGTIPGTSVTVPLHTVPADEIPLVVQDKTFVDANRIASQDPTWNWGSTPPTPHTGDLWFPHVYMPNQNPTDFAGVNAVGRWDYGPWFWPPFTTIANGPVANPLYGTDPLEGPLNPGIPNPSLVPEGYMDTPLVNGTAYPYLDVQPTAYRLRILNACNDRFLNLQFYVADPTVVTLDGRTNTEVKMVPAVSTPGFPATWPTDGRDGGVPDPATMGPAFIQIGTEGGLLPAPAVIGSQPVGYLYDRRNIVVLNVTDTALFMGPAERADVIVDFSQYAGKTLILYNDAPAPVPAFDPRNDYYTGDPNNTSIGGAPSTLAGFGPNTRTVMQIRVASVSPSGSPLTGVDVINQGAGYSAPTANITGGGGTGAIANVTGSVDNVTIENVGSGYSSAPSVAITDTAPGTGSGATAQVTTAVTGLALTNPGTGYTAAPSVAITDVLPGIGSGATAKATISVTNITLGTPGSGYVSPVVSITDSLGGTGTGATASATVDGLGAIATITLDTVGSGYTAPVVNITGGPGTGATASVTGVVDSLILLTNGSHYSTPTVGFAGGTPSIAAIANTTGSLDGVTLLSPGSGYSEPVANLSGGGGSGALAKATLKVTTVTLTNPGSGYTTAPTVTISDTFPGTGAGAFAIATIPMGTAFNATPLDTGLPAVFRVTQPAPIIKNAVYNAAYGASYPVDSYVRIQDMNINFFTGGPLSGINVIGGGAGYTSIPLVSITGGGGTGAFAYATVSGGHVTSVQLSNPGTGFTSAPTITFIGGGATASAAAQGTGLLVPLQPKAIQELFTLDYGRMNATLGVELPQTNGTIQTTIPFGYVDPPTELIHNTDPAALLGTLNDGTQIWKITHNGVDTHAIHFHMFNVQLINRVGWDGAIRPPKANEIGWKETIAMSPLEDAIVALRPIIPVLPASIQVPNSYRLLDVTNPVGSTMNFFGVDPQNQPVAVTNELINYGWEYVWHCHLLGHEENDMMRPVLVGVNPTPASGLAASRVTPVLPLTPYVHLTWTDGTSQIETGAVVERANDAGFTQNLQTFYVPRAGAPGSAQSYDDPTASVSIGYYYRVKATNRLGGNTPGFPNLYANATPTNSVAVASNCSFPTFTDVPCTYSESSGGVSYNLYKYIQSLYLAGMTAGCATTPNLLYCPARLLNRAEAGVFNLRAYFGPAYVIPPAPWPTFVADNWTLGPWAQPWAEGMWQNHLTAGCNAIPLMYCPWNTMPREQAVVFALHFKYGPNYGPGNGLPPATGSVFFDMTNPAYWATAWAEKAYADGLIPSCGTSGGKPMFCQSQMVDRAWMAYLIVNAKGLPTFP